MEGQGRSGGGGKARTQSQGFQFDQMGLRQSERLSGIFLDVTECTQETPSPRACCVPGTELHV